MEIVLTLQNLVQATVGGLGGIVRFNRSPAAGDACPV